MSTPMLGHDPAGSSQRGGGPGSIRVEGVAKVYDRTGADDWRGALPARAAPSDPIEALADLDLLIEPGESIGIIGPNGAGKTTLLRLIARVTRPTAGTVEIGGRVSAMIALGLGFHPELTGRENVRYSAELHGVPPGEFRRIAREVEEFSGVGHVLDEPLRTYSTGMQARLGFALATHVPSDILVIDEVLAVGDREFQTRCIDRIRDLNRSGVTIVFVSHALPLVTIICDRAVQIRNGRLVDDGPAPEVVERYLADSPSGFRRSAAPGATWRTVTATPAELVQWDPIRIQGELEVAEPVSSLQLGVELLLPTYAPGFVFGSDLTDVGAVSEPGRYRVTGTSRPFPGEASLMRAVISLVDGDRRETMDKQAVELRLAGSRSFGKPHLAVTPRWEVRATAPPRRDGAVAARGTTGSDVVSLAGVTKSYRHREGLTRLRRALPGRLGRGGDGVVAALDDVTLAIERGSVLGVIGANGAGKTTLLRVLAGITGIDGGRIDRRGSVIPLLELGMGFHPDLDAERNLRAMAAFLDLPPTLVDHELASIIDLAGAGDLVDVPVGRYSTGMRARLGFSLALHARPDVLLIDEVLSVGDEAFRRRAIDAVRVLRNEGAAVVLVSHELRLVEEMCDRAVRLERGRLVDEGSPGDVVERYGGSGWTAGAHDAGAGTRLHSLDVRRSHIGVGETLVAEGLLEVSTAAPTERIEMAYRIPPEDRYAVLTPEEIVNCSMIIATVEPAGGCTATPGWYDFRLEVPRNELVGEFDLVVSVVDGHDNVVISESYHPVRVGPGNKGRVPGPLLEMAWSIERLD